MTLKLIVISAVVAGLLLLVVGCKLTRHGYESPDYIVTRDAGKFEIRDYPDLPLVSTSMNSEMADSDRSFMRLFGYISGDNDQEQKISMTVPVFSSIDSESRRMSFLLPSEVAESGAPAGVSDKIQLGTMKGGSFAAYRYSGKWNVERQRRARSTLFDWLESESIDPIGDAFVASYDPPFTPPFWRRNEVLVRILAEPSGAANNP